MRTYLNLLFLLCITLSFAQKNDITWKSELDFGEGAVFTTFLNIKKSENQYIITSPKNADVRILGGLKAKLARVAGKLPKKGILLRINADQKGDSLFGDTNVPMFGSLKFRGVLTQDKLSGELTKNDTLVIGSLKGKKSIENNLDYSNLYSKIIEITKENIYSTNLLETNEWQKFKRKLKKLCKKSKDDIEFFMGFNMLNSILPFSHYNVFIEEQTSKTSEDLSEISTVLFEEKNPATAYLRITNFSTSKEELAKILPTIVENKDYKNLIVDLRNNGGGGIDAAFEFAKYVVTDDIEVGYFVTNKLKYSGFQQELFKTLPELQPKSTEEFGEDLMKRKGSKLIFKKSNSNIFYGNIYVLTNNNTGSTCEPIVYALKNTLGATVIGKKTAGAMLAATWFNVSDKYILMLPIADFYTTDGVRLDQRGVFPNIDVESEKALEKALEMISTNSNNSY